MCFILSSSSNRMDTTLAFSGRDLFLTLGATGYFSGAPSASWVGVCWWAEAPTMPVCSFSGCPLSSVSAQEPEELRNASQVLLREEALLREEVSFLLGSPAQHLLLPWHFRGPYSQSQESSSLFSVQMGQRPSLTL